MTELGIENDATGSGDTDPAAGTESESPTENSAEPITDGSDAEWTLEIPLHEQTYTLTISPEQRVRLRSVIRPKPVPDGNELQVLEDHRFSVSNVWLLILNWINQQIENHDAKKVEEGEEHKTLNPHHWPLDGYDCSDGFLPASFFIEAVCDYIATVIGRAEAGRELGWLSPTNTVSAADVLTSTVLALFEYYGLATVTPSLKNSGVTP